MDPPVQINDPPVEIHLVVTPRLAVDSRAACFFSARKLARSSCGVRWCSRSVNLNFRSFRAACRTPGNPRDLGTNGMPSAFRR